MRDAEDLLADYMKAQYLGGSRVQSISPGLYGTVPIPRYSITSLRGLLEESARLQWLAASYDRFGIDVPDDLKEEIKRNERDVKASHRADLEQRLREAEGLVHELRSQEEKRYAAEQEIEKLKTALGK